MESVVCITGCILSSPPVTLRHADINRDRVDVRGAPFMDLILSITPNRSNITVNDTIYRQ